jgi:hypothetical protein
MDPPRVLSPARELAKGNDDDDDDEGQKSISRQDLQYYSLVSALGVNCTVVFRADQSQPEMSTL